MNTYETLINRLFNINLFNGMKLGLTNSLKLHASQNFPANHFKIIHVAGSNGKGSVSTKIAKGLELSGLKVGLYTSPHISSFRERIQINSEMINEDDITSILSELLKIRDVENIPATFFEIATMLALTYFAEKKVAIAVLEAGIGGRLDATNVVEPILSIITSISLDHTDILGDTLEKIALEKAGIIKPNIPVLIGPKVPLNVIAPVASSNNSPCTQIEGIFQSFDDENNAIAKKALEFLGVEESLIIKALQVKPPCRMETIEHAGKTIILDVAHNPDGLLRLFSEIKENYAARPIRIIFGLSQNKDIDGCLSIIKKSCDSFHLVQAPNGRGLPILELKNRLSTTKPHFLHESIEDAINKALTFNDLIVVCGTFFIMSDIKRALNQKDPRDERDMNERNGFGI